MGWSDDTVNIMNTNIGKYFSLNIWICTGLLLLTVIVADIIRILSETFL